MSTNEAVKSSSDVNKQSATEIMIQVFEDLRENRPKVLEESVVTSLKLHRRYASLPNISLQSISAFESPLSETASMTQVFRDLLENRPITLKIDDIKSFQRRSKSMPNMAFETKSMGDAPEAIPSVASITEMQVLTDSAESSTNSEELRPAAVRASDFDSLLPSTPTSPPVLPLDFDAQHFSSIPNTSEPQLIGDAESAKPLEHETTGAGLQDTMVTRGGCGDTAATDVIVSAARPSRRTQWSRAKTFALRMFLFMYLIYY